MEQCLELIFEIHDIYHQKQQLNTQLLRWENVRQNKIRSIQRQLYEDDDEEDDRYKKELLREIDYKEQIDAIQTRNYGGGCSKLMVRGKRKGQTCGKATWMGSRCMSHPLNDGELDMVENEKIKKRIELEHQLTGQITEQRLKRQQKRQELYDMEIHIMNEQCQKTKQDLEEKMNQLVSLQKNALAGLSKVNEILAFKIIEYEEKLYEKSQESILKKIEEENILRQEKDKKDKENEEALQKLSLEEKLAKKERDRNIEWKELRERVAKRDAEKEQRKQEYLKNKQTVV